MKEYNLDNIWNNDNKEASDFHESVRDEIMKKARKKSKDVLYSIKRNAVIEFAITPFIIIPFVSYIWNLPTTNFIIICAMLALIIFFSLHFYFAFLRKLKSIAVNNMIEAIENYVQIIAAYKKKLTRFSFVGIPLGFYMSYSVNHTKMIEQAPDDKSIAYYWGMIFGIIIGILIGVGLAYLFVKIYYRLLLGTKIDKLRGILSELKNNVEA